jgi:hypothetical protein
MKVNEIITEAPYGLGTRIKDTLKGFVPGVTGAAAKSRIEAGNETNQLLKAFQTYVSSVGGNINNIQGSVLTKWLTTRPRNYQVAVDWVPNTVLSRQELEQVLNDVVRADIAGGTDAYVGLTGKTPPRGKASASVTSAPPASTPSPAPAPASKPGPSFKPSASANVAPGVQIVNTEPIMLKFNGTLYGLGDRGEWISVKQRRPVPPEMEAFLDQQMDAVQGAA